MTDENLEETDILPKENEPEAEEKLKQETEIKVPSSYPQEYAESFSELPEKWRNYLCERENKIDEGFKKLSMQDEGTKIFNEAYKRRAEKLKDYGINSQADWIKTLVGVDELLASQPHDAIKMLSEVYTGKSVTAHHEGAPQTQKQSVLAALNRQMIQTRVDNFVFENDDKGNLKHPYFKQVMPEMSMLLSSGMSNSIEDAYDKALWINQETRNVMLAKKYQQNLEQQSEDAQKSKQAAFSPKGKSAPDEKSLSLREEIEKQFAAYGLLDDE